MKSSPKYIPSSQERFNGPQALGDLRLFVGDFGADFDGNACSVRRTPTETITHKLQNKMRIENTRNRSGTRHQIAGSWYSYFDNTCRWALAQWVHGYNLYRSILGSMRDSKHRGKCTAKKKISRCGWCLEWRHTRKVFCTTRIAVQTPKKHCSVNIIFRDKRMKSHLSLYRLLPHLGLAF